MVCLFLHTYRIDLTECYSRSKVSWPTPLSQHGPPPVVDYSCQAGLGDGIHSVSLSLMLFGAHYRGEDRKIAVDILARAFQPMMSLFILYYLDSRSSPVEEMPWWMVLFGVVYDEKGIFIQSFYPIFTPSSPYQAEGWGANSTRVTNHYFYHKSMQGPPYGRNPTLNVLNRIQGHCRLVYEQLSRWEGLGRACERLEAEPGQFSQMNNVFGHRTY
jgi:hypothetical protein